MKQRKQNRRKGTTLVEVILGLVIIAIMGVTAIMSLFYPRHLTTVSAVRRLAVDAATDHLEQLFAMNYLTIPYGDLGPNVLTAEYNINGRTVTSIVSVEPRSEAIPGGGGDTFDYLHITAAVSYDGGPANVVLETYRSPMK
jgi:type II secretory pathway pseudopilin PulG